MGSLSSASKTSRKKKSFIAWIFKTWEKKQKYLMDHGNRFDSRALIVCYCRFLGRDRKYGCCPSWTWNHLGFQKISQLDGQGFSHCENKLLRILTYCTLHTVFKIQNPWIRYPTRDWGPSAWSKSSDEDENSTQRIFLFIFRNNSYHWTVCWRGQL